MARVPPKIPRCDATEQAAPGSEGPAAAAAAAVFLIESDDAVRDAVASALRAAGFEVVAFSSARHFLDGYGGQRGCLVADADVPGMSDPELLRQLAVLLPAIFTSARLGRLDLGDLLSRRQLLLRKPYGMDELLPLIRCAVFDPPPSD
jgi:two-component system, LuxR family, response regulator FixJ